ncbi:MAG TPA: type I methionyl aminopeptidase [Phycisphaerales bacterium]|nr:type I methionyl aminopeptidase [Phycisphaerales bacterium]
MSPAIPLLSPNDIEGVRRAGVIVEDAIRAGAAAATPGATTLAIDHAVRAVLANAGAEALFLGYAPGGASPFPASCCVSVNEEVVHGVPGARSLRAGDLVSIDVGARALGWCADAGVSVVVSGGDPGPHAEGALRLVRATRALIDLAVSRARPGVRWSAVGAAMEAQARSAGYGIVTDFVGHGVGRELHQPPKVPAYATGFTGEDFVLEAGMVLAVEPILTAPIFGDGPGGRPGRRDGWATPVALGADGWTVATRTGEWACHEEWVIGVTPEGCAVLTASLGGLWRGGGL